jgi:hypothetical protein
MLLLLLKQIMHWIILPDCLTPKSDCGCKDVNWAKARFLAVNGQWVLSRHMQGIVSDSFAKILKFVVSDALV